MIYSEEPPKEMVEAADKVYKKKLAFISGNLTYIIVMSAVFGSVFFASSFDGDVPSFVRILGIFMILLSIWVILFKQRLIRCLAGKPFIRRVIDRG